MTQAAERVAPAAHPPAPRVRARARVSDLGEAFALPFVWVLVIAVFGILKPHEFLSVSNFATIFGTQTPIALLTLAIIVPCMVSE